MNIFIGTTNPGKVAEIATLLAPLGAHIEPVALDVPETEDTFEGNARLKAHAYARHTKGLTISEDSGLLVPALRLFPGPFSARFDDYDVATGKVVESGRSREVIDVANNAKVLRLMADIKQPYRAAFFKVVLIVAEGETILFEASAESHGWIADEPKGTNGFGYDPIFVGQDTFGKTYAELDPVRKNLRSHRKKALNELYAWLSQNLERLS